MFIKKTTFQLLSNKGFQTHILCGPEATLLPECEVFLDNENKNYFVTKWVEVNGITYTNDHHHVIAVCSENLLPQFGIIKHILIQNSNKYYSYIIDCKHHVSVNIITHI